MKIKLTTINVDRPRGIREEGRHQPGPIRWLTVASAEEPELQRTTNDDPAAQARKQPLFERDRPAVMVFAERSLR